MLQRYLHDHPDHREVNFVVNGFRHGFQLGLTSIPIPRDDCTNSSMVHVARSHILGPFDEPPLPDLVYSPLHLVPKKSAPKGFHLIYDLSYPYDRRSVNSHIPEENSSVKYHYIDKLIAYALELGPNIYGVHLDILHAYRNVPLRFSELCFMAFKINGKTYIHCTLPFGISSACQLFECISMLLEWIIRNETHWHWISHFLDDYSMLGPSEVALLAQISRFLAIMEDIGMPIAHEKTIDLTQLLPYLGLLLNLVLHLLKIPEEKRVKNIDCIDTLLVAFRSRKSVTVKQIQKVVGSLNFIYSAIPAGKPFLSALHKLTHSKCRERILSGHHRRISWEVYEDLLMFRSFLEKCALRQYHSVPFLTKLKVFNTDLQLFADSSGSELNGFGCWFQDSGFMVLRSLAAH